jgi:regulator of replication initiation timing
VLAPFSDNLPYDRDRVIQECKLCLQMEIMCRFEVGRRLILLKNYEGCATLQHILDDQLGGMERTSAWRYMLFAKKAAELPRFRAFAEGKDNWSKAIALLQCCEDEDLAAFEEGADLLGLKRDELDGLSVRELKARIKKLKKDKEEAVKKATYQLAQENQELKAEVAGLQVALAGPDLEEAFKAVKAAEKKFHDGALLLRAISPGVLEREEAVRNLIFAGCDMLRRLLTQIEHNAQDALNRVLMAEASDE